MKWGTLKLIHFDRVASAWLIKRFVDTEAKFVFLEKGQRPGAEVQLFGMPDVHLAAHDGKTTTFERILTAYALRDAALGPLKGIVADTVDHVMLDPSRAELSKRNPNVAGMLAVAEGAMLLSASDDECLERCLPLYDALYARIQAQLTLDRFMSAESATVLSQTLLIARGVRDLRSTRRKFSDVAFFETLGATDAG